MAINTKAETLDRLQRLARRARLSATTGTVRNGAVGRTLVDEEEIVEELDLEQRFIAGQNEREDFA